MKDTSTMVDRRDSNASNVSRREDISSLPFFFSNFKSTDDVCIPLYKFKPFPAIHDICLMRCTLVHCRQYGPRSEIQTAPYGV